MVSAVKELMIDELRIDVTLGSGRIRLDWLGNGRIQDSTVELGPFLDKITRDALSGRAAIEVHLEQMQFCNSATIGAVVRFVRRVVDQNLDVELAFAPRNRWQQVLADTVAMFARNSGRLRLQPLMDALPPSGR